MFEGRVCEAFAAGRGGLAGQALARKVGDEPAARMSRGRARILVAVFGLACLGAVAWLVMESSGPRPVAQQLLDDLVSGPGRIAPGASAWVSGPHGTWVGSAGLANVSTHEPMRPDARMRLESVSKAWTATLLLQLVGERRLRLSDTVERWLPGLLPAGGKITVRELLDHTSGLVDNNDLLATPGGYARQITDPMLRRRLLRIGDSWQANPQLKFPARLWVEFAAALRLRSKPGTSFHYSNIGYDVAAMIAERATGLPLATLYRQKIIQPLGLASAAYDPQGEIKGPHPRGYRVEANGTLIDTTGWYTGGTGGAAGIVSDAADEATFLTALMQGTLIDPQERKAMETPSPASASIHMPYGLGFDIESPACGGTAYGHSGIGASFTSDVLVSPDGLRVAVLLLNGHTADGHGDAIAHAATVRLYCTS